MKYQSEIEFVIKMTKYAIAEVDVSTDAIALFKEYKDVNWNIVKRLTTLNKIDGLIFNYIKLLPNDLAKNIPYYDYYKIVYKKAVLDNINRMEFLDKLRVEAHDSPINYCLLKGSVSRHFYPDPTMRHMGDTDILYRNIPDNEAVILFNKLDYEIVENKPKEFIFKSKNLGLIVELQSSLVDSGYRLWYKYLSTIWSRLIKVGQSGEYKMRDEDFFIYHIIHMAKHFINGGIGLRHIVDTYVIYKHFSKNSDFDFSYVHSTLKELHIEKFYLRIMGLIDYWYENDIKKIDNATLNLTRFIITTGAFGNKKQRYANHMFLKKQNILKRVFPGATTMGNYYGIDFEKEKLKLIPYWIKLNVARAKKGKKNIEDIKDSLNISNEKIAYTKKIFTYCGLDDSLL